MLHRISQRFASALLITFFAVLANITVEITASASDLDGPRGRKSAIRPVTESDANRSEIVELLSAFNPRNPQAEISVPLDILIHSDDARLREIAASLLSRHIGFLRSRVQSGREISRELERYRQHDQHRPAWDRTPRSPLEF